MGKWASYGLGRTGELRPDCRELAMIQLRRLPRDNES